MDLQNAIGTLKKCVEAIIENNIDVFKSLVPDQISPDTYFDTSIIPHITLKYNPVPLIYLTVAYDSILCLQYLIDLGEDLNYVGPDNCTLLITAAKMNNLNSARLLIAQKVIDVNAKGKHDNTALIYAAKNGNVDMIVKTI